MVEVNCSADPDCAVEGVFVYGYVVGVRVVEGDGLVEAVCGLVEYLSVVCCGDF